MPTKRNLLLARHRLALASKGFDLLDKKRHVLISELSVVQGRAEHIWDDLCGALHFAYKALGIAQAEMGRERVQQVSLCMPNEAIVEMHPSNIMGVVVIRADIVYSNDDKIAIPYALSETTASLDEAVLAWNKARELIVTYAAIENSIYRLNLHIKKTQKRANALGNITIPMYKARIKYIQERLEERERDELSRLKRARRVAQSRSHLK